MDRFVREKGFAPLVWDFELLSSEQQDKRMLGTQWSDSTMKMISYAVPAWRSCRTHSMTYSHYDLH